MEHIHTATTAVVDAHSHATMRWSAIIGGWLVATGIASLMYVAGLATGFTAFDPYNAAATAKGIGADRLSAQGFGDTKPKADNSTAPGRATNRRIEFEVRKG